ncbi:hypothetical protein N9B63_05235, partial [Akkermansiaceae bacterium]|nr:hypothetical protein [Akkermansiaceae bacterium]
NGGETLELRDTGGVVVFSFAYNDRDPWPTRPDGEGPSLDLISPNTLSSELGEAIRWRSSETANGTPGFGTGISFSQWAQIVYGSSTGAGTGPDDIADGTTESNLIRYAQGADLTNSVMRQASFTTDNGALFATFTYQVRANPGDASVFAEVSDDLMDWRRETTIVGTSPQANGVTLITVRTATPTAPGSTKFFRLSVEINP